MGLIERKAKSAGFDKVELGGEWYFSIPNVMLYKMQNGDWSVQLPEKILCIGPYSESYLPELFTVWPEIVDRVLDPTIRHEDNHLKGHSADKVARKRIKTAIRKYGIEKFNALSEDGQKDFLTNFITKDHFFKQCDIWAYSQAIREYREAGLNTEQIEKKIAPTLWCLHYHDIRKLCELPTNIREACLREAITPYVDQFFPRSIPKEELADEAIEIDREYRRRLGRHPLVLRAIEVG